jgi:hypothetical protein
MVDQSADELKADSVLINTLRRYDDWQGPPPGTWLSGAPLEVALGWLAARADDLNGSERAFIEISRERHDAEREREHQRQEELRAALVTAEQARDESEGQRIAAERAKEEAETERDEALHA